MSATKKIRNLGHAVKDRDGVEIRRDVERVEYACRFYNFPVGQDTEVDAEVADWVQSIYGGLGLNIVQADAAPIEQFLPAAPLAGIAAAAAALPSEEPEPAPVEAPAPAPEAPQE